MKTTDADTKAKAKLVAENHVLGVRLSLAQAFVQFLLRAYDALLHHGVNYRSLPEYTAHEKALDDAAKMPVEEGRAHIIGWFGRMESAIAAAVRRTFMRVIPRSKDPKE